MDTTRPAAGAAREALVLSEINLYTGEAAFVLLHRVGGKVVSSLPITEAQYMALLGTPQEEREEAQADHAVAPPARGAPPLRVLPSSLESASGDRTMTMTVVSGEEDDL